MDIWKYRSYDAGDYNNTGRGNMSVEEVFMRVPGLGNLYLDRALVSYGYPRVFTCRDSSGDIYMFYEMSSSEERDVWLVTGVTEDECIPITEGREAIQTAYGKGSALYTVTKTYDTDKTELSPATSEWIGKLPKNPVYADKVTSYPERDGV